MIERLINLSPSNSLFLFGARGTGKSTLIKERFASPKTLWIDLLDSDAEDIYLKSPSELSHRLNANIYKRVVIDEVQKVPKLLDIVHLEMGRRPEVQFILSGSSARKLKRGSANLLAGRAFAYHLYPFSSFELKDDFRLLEALRWGTLPGLVKQKTDGGKREFLKSYARTYLREEIKLEQLIRKLRPFTSFLEIASHQSGNIVNFSNMAQDVGVDYKTIINYFSILEDTLLGSFLPAFHRSIRRQQAKAPKFYFFDTGVKRALEGTLSLALSEKSHEWGPLFEHFIIVECFRLNEFLRKDFKFFYLRTKDGAEIDLVIQRAGQKDLLVEIKSTTHVRDHHIKHLVRFQKNWKNSESEIWSCDSQQKRINTVSCFHWQEGLRKLFWA